jgi:CubicO group peptidase (beta-lactamase class C family)
MIPHKFSLNRMGYFVSLVSILLNSSAFLHAADTPAAPTTFDAIAPAMQAFVEKGDVSGIVTLVADKTKVLHLAAVGKSDLASGRKMQTDDLFWIASMTKPMTAVCIAMLLDDGKLSFDDPVEKYLPEYRGHWVIEQQAAGKRTLVQDAKPITLRNLLTHTSGMGEYVVTDPHWTLAEYSIAAAREPLRFQTGSKWGYSTAGLDACGRVVEVVSGMPFADFMQSRLLDPLKMNNSTFWVSTQNEKRLAKSYRMNAQSGKLEEAVIHYMYGGAVTDHGRPALGGAGLFSTAEDVGRFYQMMMNDGMADGKRLLKHETVDAMTHNQIGDLTARPGMPWGLGFCVVQDPSAMEANHMLAPGSYGHGGAFGTSSWIDIKLGVVYVIMLQRDGLRNPDNSDMHRVFQEIAAATLTK